MNEDIEPSLDGRGKVAYALLGFFVLFTTVGFMIRDPAEGFIALGLTSGISAYLLGSN